MFVFARTLFFPLSAAGFLWPPVCATQNLSPSHPYFHMITTFQPADLLDVSLIGHSWLYYALMSMEAEGGNCYLVLCLLS